jgi:hypothetical protein
VQLAVTRTVHAIDPLTFVYVLMGQLWHRDESPAATTVLNVPAAHKVQLTVPVLLANAPAGQGRHAVCKDEQHVSVGLRESRDMWVQVLRCLSACAH